MTTGCSLFDCYKIKKAERAPPEEAEKMDFPDSYEEGIHLDGPTLAALEVAMNEFLPPGTSVKSEDKKLARCLSSRSTYDAAIVQRGKLLFINILPRLERCELDSTPMIMDAGAVYAVDKQGRVVNVR
jgi:hypothetical protein